MNLFKKQNKGSIRFNTVDEMRLIVPQISNPNYRHVVKNILLQNVSITY